MQAEDRLIHFSTELIHSPKQHPRKALQKLYYELSQTRHGYDSTDFSQPTHVRFYSKRPLRTQSVAVILPDRVALAEEWADIALTDFYDKIREVAPRVFSELGVDQFRAQTGTLRSTFALTHFSDAKAFLLDHVCGQANRIDPYFQRPQQTGGLRFVLPETPEHRGILQVLIESSRHSPNEILVEVKGVFAKQEIDVETLEKAVENVQVCRAFIQDSVFPFLNQYDTPQEDPV